MSNIFDPIDGEPIRDIWAAHLNAQKSRSAAAQSRAQAEATINAIRINGEKLDHISSLLEHQITIQEEEAARIKSLPNCPYCGHKLAGRLFTVCGNCTKTIHWLFGILPYRDGYHDETYNLLQNIIIKAFSEANDLVIQEEIDDKRREEERRRKAESDFRVNITIAIVCVAVVVVLFLISPRN